MKRKVMFRDKPRRSGVDHKWIAGQDVLTVLDQDGVDWVYLPQKTNESALQEYRRRYEKDFGS